jgi:KDO2-lipid IV(A) lauroyltransferase
MKTIYHYFEFLLFLGLLKLVRVLKIDRASGLFSKIGRIIGPRLSVSNIARKNIAIAFPGISPLKTKQIIIDMWDNIARVAAEMPNISMLSKEEFHKKVTIIGKEYLEEVKKSGKSCIFFTGHFANWELTSRAGYDADLKLSVVYRKANNKLVDEKIHSFRKNLDITLIPKGQSGIKDIIRAFKQNRCICFLPDQKLNNGIEVPFFGINAMTATAPAKLALDYQCPIIPVQVIRTKGTNFIVKVHKPLKINYDQNNSQEIYRIMREINYIYEQWIKENPGQWFWVHKRWPNNHYKN